MPKRGVADSNTTPNILAGMNRRLLNDAKWTCRLVRADPSAPTGVPSTPLPAVIPGCIHTDLIRAGVIGHPNIADNEARTQWVGRCDWQYRCEFDADAGMLDHERVDLVFDSLDTLATIRLNGATIGDAANQFHPHRVDARDAIRAGRNVLTINLKSPINHIHAEATRLGPRPVNGDWDPYVFIRKSACNFGWDWGPKVATVGVFGDVRLEAWSTSRIESVRPLVSRDPEGSWRVQANVEIELAGGAAVRGHSRNQDDVRQISDLRIRRASPRLMIRAILGDARHELAAQSVEITDAATNVTIELKARDVSPWMPRGHGSQPLHDLTVELSRPSDSASLDVARRRIGFRTVTLDTSPDQYGSRCQLRVNDQPVIALGANWIPEGLFPDDRSPQRIRERVQQAANANLNTLRVWGGGAYESDAFYDACDELGILVWQDFMFACACYPEEEPIRSHVESEARYQIARLSSHPCVALWCGGNECIWAWQGWGFADKLKPGQTWGRGYWLDLLPRLCAELDPTRPYWPNTPWSGSLDRDVQDSNHGTRHTWDKRVEGYRDIVPRFVAEFGHQSPPMYATLLEGTEGHRDKGTKGRHEGTEARRHEGESREVEDLLHNRQRASGGDVIRYEEPMAEHFPPARDFDEWLYQAHLLQARAISLGIEWARVHRDRCGGAIFWQLNDAWAGHSWSAIDVAGRLKPMWYAVRRACAPRLLTIQPIEGRPRLFAVNETDDPWQGNLTARRIRFDGSVQSSIEIPLAISPRSSSMLLELTDSLGDPADRARECIVVDEGGARRCAVWFFEPDKRLHLDPPRARVSCDVLNGSLRLTLTAETLLRDLVVAVDRVLPDAIVSEQLFTLLPGESTTVEIGCRSQSAHELVAACEALISPEVLRSSAGAVQIQRR